MGFELRVKKGTNGRSAPIKSAVIIKVSLELSLLPRVRIKGVMRAKKFVLFPSRVHDPASRLFSLDSDAEVALSL